MRDKYWSIYTDLKHKELYYRSYRNYSHKMNTILTVFCLIMSAASITRWLIWQQLPVLWAFLIAVSQLIQMIQPHMPFAKQIVALDYLLPEIGKMMIDIEYNWNLIEDISCDKQISQLIRKYEKQYTQLDNQFIGSIPVPVRRYCEKTAKKEATAFFYQRYQINQEVENIEYAQ